MFKELKKDMEKVREMTCEQNGTINRDFKNLKRNQKEILGLKSTITELKNSLDRLKGRLRRQKNQRTLTSDQIRYCRVRLFATPWIAARQASLSITNSRNLNIGQQKLPRLKTKEKKMEGKWAQGFPSGPVVKNSPANAGDMGFDPWSGKIAHATEQLSPRAVTTNAHAPRDRVPQGKPQQGEALAHNKSSPCSLQREKAHMQQWGPSIVKDKLKTIFFLHPLHWKVKS